MENTLMKNDGLEILVESTVINNKLSDLEYAMSYSLDNQYNIDTFTESDIIEFRNDRRILEITDTDNFVKNHMKKLCESMLSKKVSLEEALTEVYKINLITEQKYDIDDIYKNATYIKEDSNIYVKFNSINTEIINNYKKSLEKKSECLNMNLYEGFFDNKLTENLSILGIVMNNLL